MKARHVVAMLVIVGLTGVVQAAEGDWGGQVGARVWMPDISYTYEEYDGEGSSTMYGPTLSLDMPHGLWLSGVFLMGEEEYESLYEGDAEGSTDVWDGEGVVGMTFSLLDVGLGFRFWRNEFGDGETVDEYGPVVYLGLGDTFGDLPVGWYGSATWNFVDLGGDDDQGGDMTHVILDAGLSLDLDPLTVAVGYRYKTYYDNDYEYEYQGPSAAVSFRF